MVVSLSLLSALKAVGLFHAPLCGLTGPLAHQTEVRHG